MNNVKKRLVFFLKTSLLLLISTIIAIVFNYNITAPLISRLAFMTLRVQNKVFWVSILMQTIVIFSIIKLVLYRQIDAITYKIIWVCYFCLLLFLLFGRQVSVSSINLNPLVIFYSLDSFEGIFVPLFNIIFFVPIGYLFRYTKTIHIVIIMIIIEFVIESTQYLSTIGIFDIDDIILNILGVYIGYLIFKNRNLLKSRK